MTVEPATANTDDRSERPTRSAALELARLHLRTGALALARTELETLAGRDLLDDPGILDLAEVRWRTGDVAGAGEAVAALLEGTADEPDDEVAPLAWVIAAEAAASHGRPTEARRYADRLRTAPAGAIDTLFAGLPRSAAWPADPLTLAPVDATLFPASGSPAGARPGATQRGAAQAGRVTGPGSAAVAPVGNITAIGGAAPGFWDAEDPADDDLVADDLPEIDPELAAVAEAMAATEAHADLATPASPPAMVDGGEEDGGLEEEGDLDDDDLDGEHPTLALQAGTEALAAGQPALAATHLGLAIRLDASLAQVALDTLDEHRDAEADTPELALVRGDAYRLLGREREARRAYGRARPSPRAPGPDARVDADGDAAGADAVHDPDPDPTQGDPA